MRSNLQIEHEGVDFNRNKEYIVVVDLGVTYGTYLIMCTNGYLMI